jgi:hypothetical protein
MGENIKVIGRTESSTERESFSILITANGEGESGMMEREFDGSKLNNKYLIRTTFNLDNFLI